MDQMETLMKQYYQVDVKYSDAAKKEFVKNGGAYHLDGTYTVFGQVYEGLDVVSKMMEQETNENDKPVKDIVIESVKIETAK